METQYIQNTGVGKNIELKLHVNHRIKITCMSHVILLKLKT